MKNGDSRDRPGGLWSLAWPCCPDVQRWPIFLETNLSWLHQFETPFVCLIQSNLDPVLKKY